MNDSILKLNQKPLLKIHDMIFIYKKYTFYINTLFDPNLGNDFVPEEASGCSEHLDKSRVDGLYFPELGFVY